MLEPHILLDRPTTVRDYSLDIHFRNLFSGRAGAPISAGICSSDTDQRLKADLQGMFITEILTSLCMCEFSSCVFAPSASCVFEPSEEI